jgi:hypothetical protein
MKTYIPGETKVQRKARKNLTKHKIQPAVVLDTAPSITVSKSSTTQKIAFVIGNGTSRTPISLHSLKTFGKIFGCNEL